MRFSLLSPDSSPNTSFTDALLSIAQIVSPWTVYSTRQRDVKELHRYFSETFSTPHVYSYLHARTGLQHIIQALGIGVKDKVCIQAFTCVVVPNAIIAAGAEPVYVDIDNTYNIDIEKLSKLLAADPLIKAVVVQHTFGVSARIEEIVEMCRARGVLVIEDCAHALYSTYKNSLLGTFGDAAIFSFGRDKVISSVNGGVAIVRDQEVAQRMQNFQKDLLPLSKKELYTHILHPFIFEIGKILFTLHPSLYTAWIEVFKKARFIPLVLSVQEKKGVQSTGYSLPNALARRALIQLKNIHENIAHRKEISTIYTTLLDQEKFGTQHIPEYASHALLRFTIHHRDIAQIETNMKKTGIYLGHWYDTVIAPKDASLASVGYVPGSCPQAEKITEHIANLPTQLSISVEQAHAIATRIKEWRA